MKQNQTLLFRTQLLTILLLCVPMATQRDPVVILPLQNAKAFHLRAKTSH